MRTRCRYPITVALAAALAWLADGAGLAAAATHTVVIEGTSFRPATLTVKAGDTVVWVNRDPFPHTATSQEGRFDSRSIAPGKSWRYRPKKTGAFSYICTLHPTMKGKLQVE